MWRCPHCGTPQAETARCWVCRRSSTACGTCRHFRRAVAANLGYCGLDRRRQALDGGEIRACWEAGDPASVNPGVPAAPVAMHAAPRARLDFIELDPSVAERAVLPTIGSPALPLTGEPRWSLWGEPDV